MNSENRDPTNLKIEARVVGHAKIRPERELRFDNATVIGEDFSGRKLDYLGAINSRFESCRFDRLRLKYCAAFGSGRKQSLYRDCSFDGSRMCMGIGGFYRFEQCSFRNVNLWEWFCFEVDIVDCVFTGRLKGVVFNGAPRQEDRERLARSRNEFLGNDFSGAELIDVSFRGGIDLTKQKLPSGPDYLYIPDAAKTFQKARAEAVTWKDLELRRVVLRWLDSSLEDVNNGQEQELFKPKDYPGLGGIKRSQSDAYFDLLRKHT